MAQAVAQPVRIQEIVEELGGIEGVRGVLVALPGGVYDGGRGSALPAHAAQDVASTVRRMTVASSTVGVPLAELLLNFGGARMLVVPITDDASVVVLLRPGASVEPVRSLMEVERASLAELLAAEQGDGPQGGGGEEQAQDREVERLRAGPLGPVLRDVERLFARFVRKGGDVAARPADMMEEQLRQWLLCCSPSPYTFPLLLDGLAQLLGDTPNLRAQFLGDVQTLLGNVADWPGADVEASDA